MTCHHFHGGGGKKRVFLLDGLEDGNEVSPVFFESGQQGCNLLDHCPFFVIQVGSCHINPVVAERHKSFPSSYNLPLTSQGTHFKSILTSCSMLVIAQTIYSCATVWCHFGGPFGFTAGWGYECALWSVIKESFAY
jgi:hypothetical protein